MSWKNIIKAEWKEPHWQDDEGKHKYDYPFSFSLFTEADWLSQDWINNLKRFMGEYKTWSEDVIDNITEWSNKMMEDIVDTYKESDETKPIDTRTDEDEVERTRRERRQHKTGSISQNREKIFSNAIGAAKYNIDNMKEEDNDDMLDINPSDPIDPKIVNEIWEMMGKGTSISSPIKTIIEKFTETEDLDISEDVKQELMKAVMESPNIATIYANVFIATQFKFQHETPKRQAKMTEHEDEGEDAHVADDDDEGGFTQDFTDKYTSSNWWKYIRNGVR